VANEPKPIWLFCSVTQIYLNPMIQTCVALDQSNYNSNEVLTGGPKHNRINCENKGHQLISSSNEHR